MRRLHWLTARPIAHRGLHDERQGAVENSASAFAAAVAGNYAIECDLQVSSDGEAMVFHDDTLDRLTDRRGLVRSYAAAEIRRIALRGSADRILTLHELLEQVDGRVPLIIEIKSHWDGNCRLAERAAQILAPYHGPCAVMSFDPDLIACVREVSPGTARGIVADRATHQDHAALPLDRRLDLRHFGHGHRTQPHFISFHWRDLPFEPVSRFRKHGGPVITWTIRSEGEAAKALRYSDQITFEGFRP